MFALSTFLSLCLAPQQPVDEVIASRMALVEPEQLRRTVEDLVAFGTRQVLSAAEDPASGTGAARAYLERRLADLVARSGGRLSVAREVYARPSRRLGREVELVNVVATLRGVSAPDRIYVVGGHYDSINSDPRDAEGAAPGANDDASGTAVVLEACRVLCEVPLAATVIFVCYDGEEMGLLGSTAHAEALAEAGAVVDGMITNDIVGNTLGMDGVRRTDYLRCFSYAPRGNDSRGRSLARAATRAAGAMAGFDVRLVYRGDRYGRGGDHAPFFREGYPSVRFTEPREDYSRQHQNVTERDGEPYGDLPSFMDFDYLARVCRLNVALLCELASAPPAPTEVRARGARESYDTRLYWMPAEGVADHEAVWRLTTSADWEGSLLLGDRAEESGNRLQAVLPGVCLDDHVVGIRSVGVDGARSRVSTPPEPDAYQQRGARNR